MHAAAGPKRPLLRFPRLPLPVQLYMCGRVPHGQPRPVPPVLLSSHKELPYQQDSHFSNVFGGGRVAVGSPLASLCGRSHGRGQSFPRRGWGRLQNPALNLALRSSLLCAHAHATQTRVPVRSRAIISICQHCLRRVSLAVLHGSHYGEGRYCSLGTSPCRCHPLACYLVLPPLSQK